MTKEKINKLKEIAEFVGLQECVLAIEKVTEKLDTPNSNLIIPLVGEFSSGKTTLINSLTDSNLLETATKPTTATIYSIFFGQPEIKAVGIDQAGNENILDINNLKNSDLKNYPVVNIYDTNDKISNNTILVDTPGLASNDKTHKQVLLSFLPNADAILLVVDINKQFTSVDKEFMTSAKQANREVFVVLTMCDTKNEAAINQSVELIKQQHSIPTDHIVCTSASQKKLSELLNLLENIDKKKHDYIVSASEGRLKVCAKQLYNTLEEISEASSEDTTLDKKLKHLEIEKSKVSNAIENTIYDLGNDIDLIYNNAINNFENLIFDKLENLTQTESSNFDAEASAYINGTARMIENDFKLSIGDILHEYSEKKIANQNDIDISLGNIDYMSYAIDSLSYDLNLQKAGHEYDNIIAKSIKIGTKVVMACSSAGTSTASDITQLASNVTSDVVEDVLVDNMTGNGMENMIKKQVLNGLSNEDLLVTSVSFVTERLLAKPQRRRMIHEYLDSNLIPQFKTTLSKLKFSILDEVKEMLMSSAQNNITQRNSLLLQLKEDVKNKHEQFLTYTKKLNEYKLEIQNNWL